MTSAFPFPPPPPPPAHTHTHTHSGDIGKGTAHPSVRLARKVVELVGREELPGEVQLAGGTNAYTAHLLATNNLLKSQAAEAGSGAGRRWGVGGAAWGGYARKLLQPYLDALEVRWCVCVCVCVMEWVVGGLVDCLGA